MTAQPTGQRSEIPPQYRWNAASVFPSAQAWEEQAGQLLEEMAELDRFRGLLSQEPGQLLAALQTHERLLQQTGRLVVYALVSHQVDTTDAEAARLYSRSQGIIGQLNGALAFIEPELLAIGREQLDRWMEALPELGVYRHYLDDLFRKAEHVRSAVV
jgi:oligoendopeptidase F